MELYSWGANSHGQLGLNHQIDLCTPQKVNVPETLSCFALICGGGGHTSVVSDNGNLMTCGLNDQGQLGDLSHLSKCSLTLQVVPGITIAKVACGWDFTLAITDSGQLLGWGSNIFGNLGELTKFKKQSHPTLIQALKDERFVDVAAGLRHSVALSCSGEIWSWGDARKGQIPKACVQTPTDRICIPTKVPFPATVKQVCCGAFFTLLLTVDGEIHGWGDNKKGQLTQNPNCRATVYTISKLAVPKCIQFSLGWSHVLAISDKNELFSWGRGDYGQLGRMCFSGMDHQASRVFLDVKVIQVCCGSEHNLAVTNDNRLFAWGWNEHGMCGKPESVLNVPLPEEIFFGPHRNVNYVGAGAGHSFAVLSVNNVHTDEIIK